MEKSKLFARIEALADVLRQNSRARAMTANHMLIAFCEVNGSPDIINLLTEAEREELQRAEEIFQKNGVSPAFEADELKRYILSAEYDPRMDELNYGNTLYNFKLKMKRKHKSELSFDLFLAEILSSPTEAMLKCSQKESVEAEAVPITTVAEPTVESFPSETTANELNGVQKLSELVDGTKRFQRTLLDKVYGQNHAVRTFVSGYFQALLHESDHRESSKPRATFLFAGPSGVGKTFLAEKAAESLGLPYCRFDMSEYSDKEANLEFCGSDEVYKHAKPGNVTGFVAQNPKCVLLFDEIEKAHVNVIYLFLQILDAGRLRDNYTDETVSFSEAIIIFTTNAGKALYEDPSIVNLSGISRKRVLKALSAEINPVNGAPVFPAAICSRFASGNVIMFNHLTAHTLTEIVRKELSSNVSSISENFGITINLSDKIAPAIMLSVGGNADARTVKGRANAFFHEELYELLRLVAAPDNHKEIVDIQTINCKVELPENDPEIYSLFVNTRIPEILVFADGKLREQCYAQSDERIIMHFADDIKAAKEILFDHDISLIVCDVKCKIRKDTPELLNVEDLDSVGRDFLSFAITTHSDIPVYLVEENKGEISQEEFLSFAGAGAMGLIALNGDNERDFAQYLYDKCNIAYRQRVMLRIARANKVLSYKSSQRVSDDGKIAYIDLFGFSLSLAADAEDSKSILSAVSRPTVRFDSVIGAEDAKKELEYFVDYLKAPIRYLRKGLRAPKGILLYGPPGTGKTLLAKATAGESDVTFIAAEGNKFLKKYVGEASEAVHRLFNIARKYAPSILFIDEIDAIAGDRSATGGNLSGDALTAFLTEMDGFNTDTTKPVFVLAATNYSVDSGKNRSLDPAILRRFDRKIFVDLPDKAERELFIRKKIDATEALKLSEEQIENIAVRSTGASLAELDSIIELALRNAIRSKNFVVTDDSFEEAFESYNGGEAKSWSPELLMRTARHEAGHALICALEGETPSYLTVVARGDHGGYMQYAEGEKKQNYTYDELLSRIRIALAGRAAEMVAYGEREGLSSGASGDIAFATQIAEKIVCEFGMCSEVGIATVNKDNMGSDCATAIRNAVNGILCSELEHSTELIRSNLNILEDLSLALINRNHLRGWEIEEILKNRKV